MSASTMVDTFDTPMFDSNEDADIPMAGSSTENWFQPSSYMDEDGNMLMHHADPLEVDMMSYDETAEYEMDDEAETDAATDRHLLDAEVYDATFQSAPLLQPASESAEHYDAHQGASETPNALSQQPHTDGGLHPPMPQSSDVAAAQNSSSSDAAQIFEVPSDTGNVHQTGYVETFVSSGDAQDKPEHNVESTTQAAFQLSEEISGAAEASLSPLEPAVLDSHLVPSGGSGECKSEGELLDSHHVLISAPLQTVWAHEEHETSISEYPEDENESRQEQTLHEGQGEEGDDASAQSEQAQVTEHVYFEPPPPILLALQVTSNEGDQPEFALFSLPESASVVGGTETVAQSAEEPLLLLQHHSSLFYEPISAVFDAFRREEYFSHLEELSEAEMALNASDLQLVISEDNVYAREVSLHDLYAMHQGVGLPGHLRLTLQSVVPRFIARYNLLRDQITRSSVIDEADESYHQEANSADGQHEHEAEAFENTTPPEQEVVHGGHAELGLEEFEQSKDADQVQNNDDNEEREQEQEQNDGHVDSAEEVGDEAEQHHSEVNSQQLNTENKLQLLHEDEFGEEDGARDLDADGIHVSTNESDQENEEHTTEYVDVVEPHEEDEEGYGSSFDEDGVDGARCGDEADESVVHAADAELEPQAAEPALVLGGVQAQELSHSMSASSSGTEDSSWSAEVEEVDASPELKQQTDHSIQKVMGGFDKKEGKFVEGDEFGDEFGDDFGDFAEEETLEDATEESAEDVDGTSKAVQAELGKFMIEFGEGAGDDVAGIDFESQQSRSRPSASPVSLKVVESTSDEFVVVPKSSSKRRLKDAESDEQAYASPPSSPNSKRVRML